MILVREVFYRESDYFIERDHWDNERERSDYCVYHMCMSMKE